MTDEFTAQEDPKAKTVGAAPSEAAKAEQGKIEPEIKPNSFSLRFGIGHISFEADNAVQIFAILVFAQLRLANSDHIKLLVHIWTIRAPPLS